MNLNITALDTDLRALERRIREIKRPLRQAWTEPMDQAQAELIERAAEITALYTLRAWTRGRLHRTQAPRELRDSCRALGIPLDWDAREHNRTVAEQAAARYQLTASERAMLEEHAAPIASVAP